MFMKRTQHNYMFRPNAPLTNVMQELRNTNRGYYQVQIAVEGICRIKFINTLKRLVK